MKDILLDEDGGFLIEDGDFVVGDSTAQEVRLILESHPGEWKQHPYLGVGLKQLVTNAPLDLAKIRKEVRRGLSYDGLDKVRVRLEEGNLEVTAERSTNG